MNLAVALGNSIRKEGSKTAVFWGDDHYSYDHFGRQAAWLASHLISKWGLQPGDRVGLWLKNRPEFISALLGVLEASGVAVPINNFLKAEEVKHILTDAGIKVLLSEQAMDESLLSLTRDLPGLGTFHIEEMPPSEGLPMAFVGESKRLSADLAVIIYTSGTTGKPKGAMLSHGNLLHNVESCRQVLEAVQVDRFAVLLPMFHSFMLCVGILLPLSVGGSIVMIRSLHPPKNILHEIQRHGATILPAIPQLFRALSTAFEGQELPLRVCISGAAPLPAEIRREFAKTFGIPLIEGYGLSEASPVVSLNPIRGPWKEGSIGIPIPDVEVSIQDDSGQILPCGTAGEICVRGGNVMLGYWNKPEETAKSMRGDWLLTGDIGYQDEEGYLFITDRKKDMLLVNGINVYPREIEEVLYQMSAIKEGAVIGRPDSRRGEQPIAFAVLNQGAHATEREIIDFLRAKLADYKVPRHVHFLNSLPRNATGKVLKTELRALHP